MDLAGSENIKKTEALGETLKEGININKSLLALKRVIKLLNETSKHIPYRDSSLTKILKDSLGGNSRTTILACISPAKYNSDETKSTLDYANDASNIKNIPTVNRDETNKQIEELYNKI